MEPPPALTKDFQKPILVQFKSGIPSLRRTYFKVLFPHQSREQENGKS